MAMNPTLKVTEFTLGELEAWVDEIVAGGGGGVSPGVFSTLNASGAAVLSTTLTVGTGATITAGGLTVTAGGLTVTADGLTVSAGGITVTGNSTITGTLGGVSTQTNTGLLTITQATANAGILASSGYSLTGSNATSLVSVTGTLNTTGAPTVFKHAITVTATDAASLMFDYLGGAGGATSLFKMTTAGAITAAGAATFGGVVTVSTGGIAVTGNSTITGTLGSLTGLTVASGGASITGNSTITGTLTALTGLTLASGVITMGATAGVTAGPFTAVTGIQTIGGVVTTLTGT